ncbi:MAG TPA: trypsin-like peptidase domain-containing protein [Gaiellaceae bacterium]|nr:trypsin-like peptidase domain-containing protein [Gaiellaceae bacterium]
MRASPPLALVLSTAVLGGAVSLLGAGAAGYLHRGGTVVVREQVPDGDAGTPVIVAKPIAGNGFSPAQIFARRSAGVVTIVSYFSGAGAAQGSGFVVSPRGTVLTSAHVVTTAGQAGGHTRPAHTVYVQFSDGDRVPARILGYDLFDDVAVVHVDPKSHVLRAVPLGDSARVVVGAPVAAIGSPFGNSDSLSVGVVSAIRRSIPSLTTNYDLVDAIQTDAPINHGNSGGPLFDARGRVIGINAQIRSSNGSSGFEGVGFAVPIDSARRSMTQILQTGTVRYAYIGIETEDLTPSIARRFGYAAHRGALIDTVLPGTGASDAGLKAGTHVEAFRGLGVHIGGDAIVAINGASVTGAEDIVRIVGTHLFPGEVARFTLVRGHTRRVVRVRLGERPSAG